MQVAITGSSGFVGTNFKKENLNYQIQDIDLLKKIQKKLILMVVIHSSTSMLSSTK
jgi:hypothetical protein